MSPWFWRRLRWSVTFFSHPSAAQQWGDPTSQVARMEKETRANLSLGPPIHGGSPGTTWCFLRNHSRRMNHSNWYLEKSEKEWKGHMYLTWNSIISYHIISYHIISINIISHQIISYYHIIVINKIIIIIIIIIIYVSVYGLIYVQSKLRPFFTWIAENKVLVFLQHYRKKKR